MGFELAVVVVEVDPVLAGNTYASQSRPSPLGSSTRVSAKIAWSLRINFSSLDFESSQSEIDRLATWQ